jgi:hypothetical protein
MTLVLTIQKTNMMPEMVSSLLCETNILVWFFVLLSCFIEEFRFATNIQAELKKNEI